MSAGSLLPSKMLPRPARMALSANRFCSARLWPARDHHHKISVWQMQQGERLRHAASDLVCGKARLILRFIRQVHLTGRSMITRIRSVDLSKLCKQFSLTSWLLQYSSNHRLDVAGSNSPGKTGRRKLLAVLIAASGPHKITNPMRH
jgi:hypothetical protein